MHFEVLDESDTEFMGEFMGEFESSDGQSRYAHLNHQAILVEPKAKEASTASFTGPLGQYRKYSSTAAVRRQMKFAGARGF